MITSLRHFKEQTTMLWHSISTPQNYEKQFYTCLIFHEARRCLQVAPGGRSLSNTGSFLPMRKIKRGDVNRTCKISYICNDGTCMTRIKGANQCIIYNYFRNNYGCFSFCHTISGFQKGEIISDYGYTIFARIY